MDIHTHITSPISPSLVLTKNESSLIHFIFRQKTNRKALLVASAGSILQLVIFKLLYPFPDFISDSYSYIDTNLYNMKVNLWPIGYSKFIALIHAISHSDTFLITVQYFILQASLVYFFFTITYLYQPKKSTARIIYIFLFFNPLFLYLSNCVLSDALFTALTIIFIAQFLWMLHRPTIGQVFLQGFIIGLSFTIRYTAAFYPPVALAGLLLSRHSFTTKIWGTLLGIALIVPFVLHTKQKTKEITGTSQFSVFGGWQLANNALYMYNHITVDSTQLPTETAPLDQLTKRFFKKYQPSDELMANLPGTFFMKVPQAILKPYMLSRYNLDDAPSQFKAWGMVSPLYQRYGNHLITHYPLAFARYYLLMNTKNYFLPHLEKFGSYNLEEDSVWYSVQVWFQYKTPAVRSISKDFQGKLFYTYPILFTILNAKFSAKNMLMNTSVDRK